MSEAVKPWDRTKPFKRINNDDILAKQNPKQADGDGVACGCQLPSDYPDLQNQFNDAFKNFKPGELQSIIESVQSKVDKAAKGLEILAALASAALATAAKEVADAVDTVLKTTDDEIKKLLSQIGFEIAQRAIRVMPHWVPVLKGASNDSITADQIVEVEGLASRSYMDPIDVPFRQWHNWFNWNFNIVPEDGYNVRSDGVDEPPNTDDAEGAEVPLVHNPHTIEVQWDAGALWGKDIRGKMEAGFSGTSMALYDGPMLQFDWAWPMTSNYVWAAGRWVYDCSRTTTNKAAEDGTPPPARKMCTMINPCKAIASARWQAFQFPENEAYSAVPAIQFMFLACKRGGYMDFPTITDQDYEFIVDLPHLDIKPPVPFPIGHTPDFPHNTIVMRPRLLLDLNTDPFNVADAVAIEPIIEIIYPDDSQKAPEQVKVRVPLTTLTGDPEACGFILTMGWYDPFLEQAKKVKKCNFGFTDFSGIAKVRNSLVNTIRNELKADEGKLMNSIKQEIGKINLITLAGKSLLVQDLPWLGKKLEDLGAFVVEKFLDLLGELDEEDWLLRMGVNGQWQSRYFDSLKQSNILKLQIDPIVHFAALLSDDDVLMYASNGADFGPVGAIMRGEKSSRMFQYDSQTPTWSQIVTPDPDPDKAKEIRQKMAIAYALNLIAKGSLGFGLGRDNQPIGFLDPKALVDIAAGNSTAQIVARGLNPIQVGKVGAPFNDEPFEAKPLFARALPEEKILVESDSTGDSSFFYSVSIEGQDDV